MSLTPTHSSSRALSLQRGGTTQVTRGLVRKLSGGISGGLDKVPEALWWPALFRNIQVARAQFNAIDRHLTPFNAI